ncbi:hypothetical protein BIV57_08870 [Mangrovactinospora gilvigrisea]|uniref:Uncharacterized protein n=1 Tax=Mangrovactinospora gilvigrisea TaxID=1428644 RepID=A0A1J7BGQ2_9ACTN|nr:DUF6284 family protein [Mangrovactinospora gilvigrisea]OIV37863.1 hypothetical protein BIV57_08870 [Mangrovactinospora gilvigrisea]
MQNLGTNVLYLAIPDVDGPSDAELDAIEAESPVILADVALLDAMLPLLVRAPSELDIRRIRRANARALTARRDLANRRAAGPVGGAA